MAKLQVAVCDMPGCEEKGARWWEVRNDDGTLKADLCEAHAAPLRELRDQLPRSLFVRPGERKKAMRITVDPGAI